MLENHPAEANNDTVPDVAKQFTLTQHDPSRGTFGTLGPLKGSTVLPEDAKHPQGAQRA